jgi:3-hydroxyisobutyrate dehydrogenase-like beta-hydroxyacid dehydrogenase
MTKVAFIGLGRMGHGMAGRYLDAGFVKIKKIKPRF